MTDIEKVLGTFAIILAIVFSFVSVYAHFGRSVFLSKEQVRKSTGKARKYFVVGIAILNFIYSIIYVDGYKYIKLDIIQLVKPITYHLLVYSLVNAIAVIFFFIAILSKKIFSLFCYLPYVVQWLGCIIILANEIMFTSYAANIACASILVLALTPIVFLVPTPLQINDKPTPKNMERPSNVDIEYAVPLMPDSDKIH
jgi:hypothetical protein